jgi:hypothetical protein
MAAFRPGGAGSEDVKTVQSALDRFRHFSDQGGRLLPGAPRQGYPRGKIPDQGVAAVFQVELKALR